jgi:hypothetical protein
MDEAETMGNRYPSEEATPKQMVCLRRLMRDHLRTKMSKAIFPEAAATLMVMLPSRPEPKGNGKPG